jgi:hypothetical protein
MVRVRIRVRLDMLFLPMIIFWSLFVFAVEKEGDKSRYQTQAKRAKPDVQNDNSLAKSIMDVTTPLWQLDYDKQLLKKEQDMRRVHLKIARQVLVP